MSKARDVARVYYELMWLRRSPSGRACSVYMWIYIAYLWTCIIAHWPVLVWPTVGYIIVALWAFTEGPVRGYIHHRRLLRKIRHHNERQWTEDDL